MPTAGRLPPLIVDLDQTLIRSDMLVESSAALVRTAPWKGGRFCSLLASGNRALLKDWLSGQTEIDVSLLPYRQEVLELIRQRRAQGQKIVLATASSRNHALAVSKHLQLFDDVLASDAQTNLKAERKLDAIRQWLQQRGAGEHFEYVGDSKADIPIFKAASRAYAFTASEAARRAITAQVPDIELLGHQPPRLTAYLKQLRPHQWAKNALLFIPLLLAYQWTDLAIVFQVALAAVLFSFAASAVYVLNDFVDVQKDRAHPSKCRRPMASGAVPLHHAPLLFGALLVLSIGGSLALFSPLFTLILAVYFVANVFYSFWLKQKPVVDVVALTLMYVIRILAGAVAVQLIVSDWLLLFSMFLFLSLAFGKRCQELLQAAPEKTSVRGYRTSDTGLIQNAGVSCGIAAILVMALFIRSEEVTVQYQSPQLLWLLCPLLLYWILRFWIVTIRGAMHDDPIVFALKDRVSYVVAVAVLVIVLASHFLG